MVGNGGFGPRLFWTELFWPTFNSRSIELDSAYFFTH